jgi:hypothetical protein
VVGAASLPGPDAHWLEVTREIDRFRLLTLDPLRYPKISFEVFLLWLQTGKASSRNDEHWQTQTVLLRWPEVKFDFLGRFENLAEESKALLALMGAEIAFPTQNDVKFLATGASDRVAQFYTDAAFRLCDQVYARDFENFGYAHALPR